MQELLAREIDAPVLLEAMRGDRGGMDQVVVGLANGKIKASAFLGGPLGSATWEQWFLDHVPLVMAHGTRKPCV